LATDGRTVRRGLEPQTMTIHRSHDHDRSRSGFLLGRFGDRGHVRTTTMRWTRTGTSGTSGEDFKELDHGTVISHAGFLAGGVENGAQPGIVMLARSRRSERNISRCFAPGW
jgi:hypothetical protein